MQLWGLANSKSVRQDGKLEIQVRGDTGSLESKIHRAGQAGWKLDKTSMLWDRSIFKIKSTPAVGLELMTQDQESHALPTEIAASWVSLYVVVLALNSFFLEKIFAFMKGLQLIG